MTRTGTLELRVPLDWRDEFSASLFERYKRSDKALVAVLAELYVGVSTRKVKTIIEICTATVFRNKRFRRSG